MTARTRDQLNLATTDLANERKELCGQPVEYVVIAGHGRSGSNRLLDVFDQHPRTLCRNEPNEASGSPFDALPGGFFLDGPDRHGFIDAWRRAIAQAGRQASVRDRLAVECKDYAGPAWRRRIARPALARPRVRALAAFAAPALRQETFPAAPLFAAAAALEQSLPVFKLLLKPGWLLTAFPEEPGMRLALNVRAPRPFLRSWRRRYVAAVGPEKVFADNHATLGRILDHFGESADRFDRFTEATLYESELWRWRYMNETLFTACRNDPRFALVTYEGFEESIAEEARRLYDLAGLEFDDAARTRVESMRNTLFRRAPSTGGDDAAPIDEAIKRVLSDSPLLDLWDGREEPSDK
ncbi:MAG: hypothetical protein AAFX08_00585 [Pseudomonadota bacterium]